MSRIDIAVICFNYAQFLRQCVESVLEQSHRDCRVLIIDDASTDATPKICAALAAEDDRVEILRHPVNLGHVRTFNEAVRLAEGDYFLLLSADDFLLPGAIERAVTVLDQRPEVGLVHGAWLPYRTGDAIAGAAGRSGQTTLLDPAEFIWDLVLENRVATATAVVRTSVQKALGGYLAELPHSGDFEMWLRFALNSRVAYLDALQAAYRRHESNMSLGYSGLDDFEQRNAAIARHLSEIRDRLPGGASLEQRIRLRLSLYALSWMAFALRRRQLANLRRLIAFSLLNGMQCMASMLQTPSGLPRKR